MPGLSQEAKRAVNSIERPVLLHPTDFSEENASALAHAVRIALRSKHQLVLLHVAAGGREPPKRSGLKYVVDVLERWKYLPVHAEPEALERLLDFKVTFVSVPADHVRAGILDYLGEHPCDLAVIATVQRKGLSHWLERSTASRALRKAQTMMLFMRQGKKGLVDVASGEMRLQNVLVPIDGRLDVGPALLRIEELARELSPQARIHWLHVGEQAPKLALPEGLAPRQILTRQGDVATAILEVAQRVSADLIAMPTAGRQGLLAALRGSVTAKILEDARWPVLSTPVN